MRRHVIALILSIVLGAGASSAASSENTMYQWQWPAGRAATEKIAVTVQEVRKERRGLFGLNRAASIGTNFPDPMVVEGQVVAGPAHLVSRTVRLRLPKAELGQAASNSVMALGILEDDIVICVASVPEDTADASAWLADWSCP